MLTYDENQLCENCEHQNDHLEMNCTSQAGVKREETILDQLKLLIFIYYVYYSLLSFL